MARNTIPANNGKVSLELLYVLNAIGMNLQKSIQSETKLFEAFRQQIIALGLRGGISLLDEQANTLVFKMVAYANPLRWILGRAEKTAHQTADCYTISVDKVDVYRRVIRQREHVFLCDTSVVTEQVLPSGLKSIVEPLIISYGN